MNVARLSKLILVLSLLTSGVINAQEQSTDLGAFLAGLRQHDIELFNYFYSQNPESYAQTAKDEGLTLEQYIAERTNPDSVWTLLGASYWNESYQSNAFEVQLHVNKLGKITAVTALQSKDTDDFSEISIKGKVTDLKASLQEMESREEAEENMTKEQDMRLYNISATLSFSLSAEERAQGFAKNIQIQTSGLIGNTRLEYSVTPDEDGEGAYFEAQFVAKEDENSGPLLVPTFSWSKEDESTAIVRTQLGWGPLNSAMPYHLFTTTDYFVVDGLRREIAATDFGFEGSSNRHSVRNLFGDFERKYFRAAWYSIAPLADTLFRKNFSDLHKQGYLAELVDEADGEELTEQLVAQILSRDIDPNAHSLTPFPMSWIDSSGKLNLIDMQSLIPNLESLIK
jgi:hypothetical protein